MIAKKSPKTTSPLILVGTPGSGASQLFKKLAEAENVHVLDDAGRERLMAILPRRKDSDCLTEADATPAVVAALSKLAQAPVGENGTRVESRFLLSLKSAALQIPFWAAVFPDAKFVFVQRDANQQIDRMITAWNSGKAVTRPQLAGWEGPQWSLPLIPGFQALAGKSIQEIAAAQWAAITAQALHALGHLSESRWCALSYDKVVDASLDAAKWNTLFAGLNFHALFEAGIRHEYQALRHAAQVAEVAPLVREIAQAAARVVDTRSGSLDLESVARRNPFTPRKPSLIPAKVAKAVSVGRLAASLFMGTALLPSASQADVFEVSNTNAGGSGSLLWAIQDANYNEGHDTIVFSPSLSGVIDLNGDYEPYYGPGPVFAYGGYSLEIDDSVTIQGPGADKLAIEGGDERIFDIEYGDVVIEGLTLQESYDSSSGSAIRVHDSNLVLRNSRIVNNFGEYGAVAVAYGDLTVENVAFIGNEAYYAGGALVAAGSYVTINNSIFADSETYYEGGAIAAYSSYVRIDDSQIVDNSVSSYEGQGGALRVINSEFGIRNSIVSGNFAYGDGGALSADDALVGILNSVFSGNRSAYGTGGAIAIDSGGLFIDRSSAIANIAEDAGAIFSEGGELSMRDSTLSGNTAYGVGGGLLADGNESYLEHLTIVNNQAYLGGGIFGWNSLVYLDDSIVANNPGEDLYGDDFYIQYSLVKDNSGGAGYDPSNLVNVDPKLSGLVRSGKTAFVHKPLAGSPVINAGNDTFASGDGETDNRGLPRIIDGRTDMGAVEFSTGSRGEVADDSIFPPAENPFANVIPVSLSTAVADSSGCTAGGSAGGLLPLGFMAAAAALRRRKK